MKISDGSTQFALGNRPVINEGGRPWYDSVGGIEKAMTSLEGFANLIQARHTAGYGRGERMNEYYVLGRYSLDSCGNCGKFSDWIPKEKFPNLPNVMQRTDFWAFMKVAAGDSVRAPISMGSDLPTDGVTCPICKQGWDIGNCHEVVTSHNTEVFPLADFVGRTLGEVRAAYSARTDAHYFMQSDCLIRNDRFIDLSPKYPNPASDWEKKVVKNERGWISAKDGADDDYVIQVGDEGYFNVWKYYHPSCNRLNIATTEEAYFRDVFAQAGFMFSVMHHLPNGYSPRVEGAPWFRVETEIGPITIGWRKRVISIDWSETTHTGKDILSLFQAESVTKEKTYIHAEGREKAIEYLSKLRVELA